MNNFFSLRDFKNIYAGQLQIKEIYLGAQKIYSSLVLSVIINNPFPSEVDLSSITIFDTNTNKVYYDGSELMGTENFAVECSVDGFYANYSIDTSEEGKVTMTIDIKASDRELYVEINNQTDQIFEYRVYINNNGNYIEHTSSTSEVFSIPYGASAGISYHSSLTVEISPQDYWPTYTENSRVNITVTKANSDYLCQASIYSNIDLCPEGSAEDWFPAYTTVTLYFRGEIIYQEYLSIENQYGGQLFSFDEGIYCSDVPQQGDFICTIIYEDTYPDHPRTWEFNNSVDFTVWEDSKEISIYINVNE